MDDYKWRTRDVAKEMFSGKVPEEAVEEVENPIPEEPAKAAKDLPAEAIDAADVPEPGLRHRLGARGKGPVEEADGGEDDEADKRKALSCLLVLAAGLGAISVSALAVSAFSTMDGEQPESFAELRRLNQDLRGVEGRQVLLDRRLVELDAQVQALQEQHMAQSFAAECGQRAVALGAHRALQTAKEVQEESLRELDECLL
eukprot:g32869.t1